MTGDDSAFLVNVFGEYLKSFIIRGDGAENNLSFGDTIINALQAQAIIGQDPKESSIIESREEMAGQMVQRRPFLAHLCLHSIHEPHPALPEYYQTYEKDPDYLGAIQLQLLLSRLMFSTRLLCYSVGVITQLDSAVGMLMDMLHRYGLYEDTVIVFSSDNGPHMGNERSDITYSTGIIKR